MVTRSEETTATASQKAGRTAQLLALMTKGDDMFNARDFAALDAVHHPDMIAYIPGNAQPIYGRAAHAVAMRSLCGFSRTSTYTLHTRPSSAAATGSPWSPVPREALPGR